MQWIYQQIAFCQYFVLTIEMLHHPEGEPEQLDCFKQISGHMEKLKRQNGRNSWNKWKSKRSGLVCVQQGQKCDVVWFWT